MKGLIKSLLKIITFVFVILVLSSHKTKADDLIKGVSTSYCIKGITASGEITHQGICAGSPKYLGKKIEIYQRLPGDKVGMYLGMFDCKDTGKTKAIRNGYCIDVWMPDQQACQKWMDLVYLNDCNGKIYFKIIEK